MSDSPASRMLQSVQNTAQPTTQQWLQPPSDVATSITQPTQATQPVANDLQQSKPDTVPQQSPPQLSDQQKLATFETLLSEMDAEKQTVPAVTPEAMPDSPQQQEPQSPPQPVGYSSTIHKEQAPGVIASPELPGGMQYVESEPLNPEIPAEVESYLQKVEEHPSQLPHEIVIAAEQHAAANTHRNLPQDVKVLPVTQAQMEEGKKKSPAFSIKWLVTFSEKLAEMFKGKAVYRQE